MKHFRQATALILAAVMMLSLAACGSRETAAGLYRPNPQINMHTPVEKPIPTIPGQQIPLRPEPTSPTSEPFVPFTPVEPAAPELFLLSTPTEPDRESLEQIAELLDKDEELDYEDLTDEELTDLIESELALPEATVPAEPVHTPVADPEENAGDYDEQGAMAKPFDQIYPELIETAQVVYDEQTLLLKLPLSLGGEITGEMSAAGVAGLELLFELENAAWYEAKLVLDTDVPAAVEALRAIEDILMVDYNYQVHTAGLGDMEAIPETLLSNTRAEEQWYLGTCGIPSGMAELTTPGGDRSIIVAVIDTGVDYDHEDLAGNIWVNENEIPDDGIDNDSNGYIDDCYGANIVTGEGSGDDDNGHGTHVAGIIAAQNNNLGTVGIAWNVRIMPIKAAMAALLRSEYSDTEMYPTKFIYGQLTGTTGTCADCLDVRLHGPHSLPGIVDLYSALTRMPQPEVGLSENYWFDTPGFEADEISANNGDGVIDAGETIALGLVLRNRWGKADDTLVTIDTLSQAGISDPYITIHNDEVNYGSVGTYSDQDAGRSTPATC